MVPVTQEDAWEFAADVRNAPRWVFGVGEVAGDLRHPLLPGDRLRVRLVVGGRIADSAWVVGECRRPSYLISSGRALGATATLRIECRELGPRTAEVHYSLKYELPGGALGALASRMGVQGVLELQVKQSLRTLRRLLSSGSHRAETGPAALEPSDSGSR